MDRIYRIRGGRYAVERNGKLSWMIGDVFGSYDVGEAVPEDQARAWMVPVDPSIVVCIGLNYKDHAAEMNKKLPEEPLIFMKPSSSVIGPEDEIRLPEWAGRIEHEAEMALVIKRRAFRVKAGHAMDYVLGLTCLNDVTARELQAKDGQYARAKGFDTFAPIGPGIAVGLDPSALAV
jgi:2-keto-4-pentenoate hydratase/2-oxohepta-3-ene-1,7-dioic acid hydratase in catechol pathway